MTAVGGSARHAAQSHGNSTPCQHMAKKPSTFPGLVRCFSAATFVADSRVMHVRHVISERCAIIVCNGNASMAADA
ncbi:MAG: hypothetical protein ACI83P_001170 [Janthinobacterium sp.]|jgi:hypothetical protein